jgi:hypothetical protein
MGRLCCCVSSTGSCAWHPTQRTERGADSEAWQSLHAATRCDPNEMGNRRSWPGGGAAWVCNGLPVVADSEAGTVAGTQATAR